VAAMENPSVEDEFDPRDLERRARDQRDAARARLEGLQSGADPVWRDADERSRRVMLQAAEFRVRTSEAWYMDIVKVLTRLDAAERQRESMP
jgi:hypothetical protein